MTEVMEKVDFVLMAGKEPKWEEGLANNPSEDIEEALRFVTREEYLSWVQDWKAILVGLEKDSRSFTRAYRSACSEQLSSFAWKDKRVATHDYGWKKREMRHVLTGMYALRRLSRLKAGILTKR